MTALAIDEILFNLSPGETRAALVSRGRLVELAIARAARPSLVGNIYLARLGKVVAGANGAFVELGSGGTGFLPLGEIKALHDRLGAPMPRSRHPSEGAAALMQVVKDATGAKGPQLSAQLALPGRWLVLTPTRAGVSVSRRIGSIEERRRLERILAPQLAAGEGVTLRTAAEGVAETALLDELARLRRAWAMLLDRARAATPPALIHAEADVVARVLRDHGGRDLRRVICDSREALARAADCLAGLPDSRIDLQLEPPSSPLFARHDIEDQIAAALEPIVALPSGGRLVIGALEALTAIDVDTARRAGSERFEDVVLAVNLEAAAEIARQVRLRNLAGLIVVDFVHMERPAYRKRVIGALHAAFADDPLQVRLGGMTALGLFEMTRKRVRPSLRDMLTAPCDACEGGGRVRSAEAVAYELLRAVERMAAATPGRALTAIAAAAVIAALEGEAGPARRALEARLGASIALRADPQRRREQFEIVTG
ncbi:MAG TPA: Rne/Rng family ribonuclease [Alphaproteobacteria bacterium]|nr:Rne/Rng family ribonuclease [Alphaproteobacteria bacterium]